MSVVNNVLNTNEIKEILSIIDINKANVIHGENRMMQTFGNKAPSKLQLHKWNHKIQNLTNEYSIMHDCSIIFTLQDAQPQVWHMDALEKFLVINVMLTSTNGTEFLDVPYSNRDQAYSINDLKDFDYPLVWNDLNYKKASIKPGDAIVFWSNMIHRGPGTLSKEPRISLYLSFYKPSQPIITTKFAFPNWAWFDSHFDDAHVTKRSMKEIDFLLQHEYLVSIFPDRWFEDRVLKSVQDQIHKRKLMIEKYSKDSSGLNIYNIYWEADQKWYLGQKSIQDNMVKIIYFSTNPNQQNVSIEYQTLSEWSNVKKQHITHFDNLSTGGYEIRNKKNDIILDIIKGSNHNIIQGPKTVYVFPFSNRIFHMEEYICPIKIQLNQNQSLHLFNGVTFFHD